MSPTLADAACMIAFTGLSGRDRVKSKARNALRALRAFTQAECGQYRGVDPVDAAIHKAAHCALRAIEVDEPPETNPYYKAACDAADTAYELDPDSE
jgi:hypothetical protein